MVDEFEKACIEVGRDPATVRRSWGGGCVCASTETEARRLADIHGGLEDDDDFDFVGTPEQIVAQMRPFIDLGVDYFMVDCAGFPQLTTLELLVNEVLPALN